MKMKLSAKLIFGFFILLFIIQGLKSHFAEIWAFEKIRGLENNFHDYDLFFIGSSLSLKHLNPIWFDSIVGKQDYSYNLSIAGCGMPESFKYIDEVVEKIKPTNQEKFVVIEVHAIRPIWDVNVGTIRQRVIATPSNLLFVSKYFFKKERYSDIKNYVYACLQNVFGVNLVYDIISDLRYSYQSKERYYQSKIESKIEVEMKKIDLKEEELREKMESIAANIATEIDAETQIKELQVRIKKLSEIRINKELELKDRLDLILERTAEKEENRGYVANKVVEDHVVTSLKELDLVKDGILDDADKILLAKFNSMIRKAKEKNVRLIFYMSVMSDIDFDIINNLPEENTFRIEDNYDQFYNNLGLWKNRSHLNEDGAKIFTKMIADEFKNTIK